MDIRTQISGYTGLSREEQGEAEFAAAYEWLDYVLTDEPEASEMIPMAAGFWPWWSKVWKAIDMAFLDSIKMNPHDGMSIHIPGHSIRTHVRSEAHLAAIWKDYHNVRYVPVNTDIIYRGIKSSIRHKIQDIRHNII